MECVRIRDIVSLATDVPEELNEDTRIFITRHPHQGIDDVVQIGAVKVHVDTNVLEIRING